MTKPIFYWKGIVVPKDYQTLTTPKKKLTPAQLNQCENTVNQIRAGEYLSADLDFKGRFGHTQYIVNSFRLNKRDRLLCQVIGDYLVLHSIVLDHNYPDPMNQGMKDLSVQDIENKIKKGTMIFLENYPVDDNNNNNNNNHSPASLSKYYCFNNTFITLSDEQTKVINCKLPLLLEGAPGSGKSSSSFVRIEEYYLNHLHAAEKKKALYVTNSQHLVDSMKRNWTYSTNPSVEVEFLTYAKLMEKQQSNPEKYDFIVVDEAQNNSTEEIKKICELLVENDIIFCIGPRQKLNNEESINIPIKQLFHEKNIKLNEISLPTSYRCPPNIIPVVNGLATLMKKFIGNAYKKEMSEIKPLTDSSIDNGNVSWLLDNQLTLLSQHAKTIHFAIIAFSEDDAKEAAKTYGALLVFTPEQIQGLEFDYILIYHPTRYLGKEIKELKNFLNPNNQSESGGKVKQPDTVSDKLSVFLTRYFTAMTRARKQLWILDNSHHLNEHFNDYLKKFISSSNRNTTHVNEPTLKASTAEEWKEIAKKMEESGNKNIATEILKKHPTKENSNITLASLDARFATHKYQLNKDDMKNLSNENAAARAILFYLSKNKPNTVNDILSNGNLAKITNNDLILHILYLLYKGEHFELLQLLNKNNKKIILNDDQRDLITEICASKKFDKFRGQMVNSPLLKPNDILDLISCMIKFSTIDSVNATKSILDGLNLLHKELSSPNNDSKPTKDIEYILLNYSIMLIKLISPNLTKVEDVHVNALKKFLELYPDEIHTVLEIAVRFYKSEKFDRLVEVILQFKGIDIYANRFNLNFNPDPKESAIRLALHLNNKYIIESFLKLKLNINEFFEDDQIHSFEYRPNFELIQLMSKKYFGQHEQSLFTVLLYCFTKNATTGNYELINFRDSEYFYKSITSIIKSQFSNLNEFCVDIKIDNFYTIISAILEDTLNNLDCYKKLSNPESISEAAIISHLGKSTLTIFKKTNFDALNKLIKISQSVDLQSRNYILYLINTHNQNSLTMKIDGDLKLYLKKIKCPHQSIDINSMIKYIFLDFYGKNISSQIENDWNEFCKSNIRLNSINKYKPLWDEINKLSEAIMLQNIASQLPNNKNNNNTPAAESDTMDLLAGNVSLLTNKVTELKKAGKLSESLSLPVIHLSRLAACANNESLQIIESIHFYIEYIMVAARHNSKDEGLCDLAKFYCDKFPKNYLEFLAKITNTGDDTTYNRLIDILLPRCTLNSIDFYFASLFGFKNNINYIIERTISAKNNLLTIITNESHLELFKDLRKWVPNELYIDNKFIKTFQNFTKVNTTIKLKAPEYNDLFDHVFKCFIVKIIRTTKDNTLDKKSVLNTLLNTLKNFLQCINIYQIIEFFREIIVSLNSNNIYQPIFDMFIPYHDYLSRHDIVLICKLLVDQDNLYVLQQFLSNASIMNDINTTLSNEGHYVCSILKFAIDKANTTPQDKSPLLALLLAHNISFDNVYRLIKSSTDTLENTQDFDVLEYAMKINLGYQPYKQLAFECKKRGRPFTQNQLDYLDKKRLLARAQVNNFSNPNNTVTLFANNKMPADTADNEEMEQPKI